jgi:DNA invertase Pin-like site-specific DNA recombinase
MGVEVHWPGAEQSVRRRRRTRKLVAPEDGRAFGYGRVSTNNQDAEMPVQRAGVDRYFKFRCEPAPPEGLGLKWGGFLSDPKTSARVRFRERAAGRALWEQLRPGDHVIVAHFDRAFRSQGDAFSTLEDCQERGVYFHFLDPKWGVIDTSGPLGDCIVMILALCAKMERQRIRERIGTAMAHHKEAGRCVGNFGIGFRLALKRVPGKRRARYSSRTSTNSRSCSRSTRRMAPGTPPARWRPSSTCTACPNNGPRGESGTNRRYGDTTGRFGSWWRAGSTASYSTD